MTKQAILFAYKRHQFEEPPQFNAEIRKMLVFFL